MCGPWREKVKSIVECIKYTLKYHTSTFWYIAVKNLCCVLHYIVLYDILQICTYLISAQGSQLILHECDRVCFQISNMATCAGTRSRDTLYNALASKKKIILKYFTPKINIPSTWIRGHSMICFYGYLRVANLLSSIYGIGWFFAHFMLIYFLFQGENIKKKKKSWKKNGFCIYLFLNMET